MILITSALSDIGPMSAAELTLHTGATRLAINKQIKKLRDQKMIHIERHDHQPDGQRGSLIPVYCFGPGEDAPPKPRTASERGKRFYRRHRAILAARAYPHVRQNAGVWAGLI